MDNKDMADNSAIPVIKTEENSENLLKNDNKELAVSSTPEDHAEETIKVEESEKIELVAEISEEVNKINNPSQIEDATKTLGESLQSDPLVEQPVSDQLISTNNLIDSAVPAQESLMEPTQDQIVPIGQASMMEGSQQGIPVTESDVKIEENGVDLDQQSVLSMKDSELKDLVMRELSEFLTEEPSQNAEPPLLEIKPDNIKKEEQKKIENNLSEPNKMKEEPKSENDIADALSTLATAALNQAPPTNGTIDNAMSKITQPAVVQAKQEGPAWCDVGVIKSTTCLIKQFFSTSITDEHENTNLDQLPDYTKKLKIDIQPGTAYKLRIAAINACGRGEWSEISAFKTCLPGYPGAPSAIKITKASDGAASLTWEAPPTSSGKILEYSVCLAIKNPKEVTPQSPKPPTTNLNFVRVYCGPHNAAVVSHESLGAALIDRTNKPAIIFRIAAKNEKGYGPATQVRWLQDSNVPGSNKNSSLKRERSINLLTGVPKRPKI